MCMDLTMVGLLRLWLLVLACAKLCLGTGMRAH